MRPAMIQVIQYLTGSYGNYIAIKMTVRGRESVFARTLSRRE
ncbi:hypothetical protein Br6_05105 [Rhodococcus sp. Br-6]|nr:hypothetical protein Br6_05105 [Rhodococcus sp. Br-6]